MKHLTTFSGRSLVDDVKSFIRIYNTEKGKEKFGDTLDDLARFGYDYGACSMVANELYNYLKDKHYKNLDTITHKLSKYKGEQFGELGDDGNYHTAVSVDNIVVDLTFGQFDRHAEYPLIINKDEWIKLL